MGGGRGDGTLNEDWCGLVCLLSLFSLSLFSRSIEYILHTAYTFACRKKRWPSCRKVHLQSQLLCKDNA